jgi:hypothetical protein
MSSGQSGWLNWLPVWDTEPPRVFRLPMVDRLWSVQVCAAFMSSPQMASRGVQQMTSHVRQLPDPETQNLELGSPTLRIL